MSGTSSDRPDDATSADGASATGRTPPPSPRSTPRPSHDERVQALAVAIGHRFERQELLAAALVHPSYRNERRELGHDNQRLEFLGDAALDLVISEALFDALPDATEGVLTMLRARIVCEPSLAAVARELELGAVLRLGRGEIASGGRERDSLLADAVEAVLGAVFLDGGYAAASRVVLRCFGTRIEEAERHGPMAAASAEPILALHGNWKTALQQRLQRRGLPLPRYRVDALDGPPHERRYTVEVAIETGAEALLARGVGVSKKAAEADAARAALTAWTEAEEEAG